MNKTREAVFSGKFYPAKKRELEKLLKRIFEAERKDINSTLAQNQLIGAIVPHAGYIYSGYQAVHAYQIIKESMFPIETYVIINPNHTGLGNGNFNLSEASNWETPLGNVVIDEEFSEALQIEHNRAAHEKEHSGEVQLPMLQHFMSVPFRVVMITMNLQTPDSATMLAHKIKAATEDTERKIFVIASSDFSHFETADEGARKDQYVIDEILRLNSPGVYEQVKTHNISACGYGPIMTLINYVNMESKNAKIDLLKRGHSGEISPSQKVVDYASFIAYA